MPESPTIIAEGTQAATVGTEHTLDEETTAHTYVLVVDASNLASGDVLELRLYSKVRAASTQNVAYYATFSGAQSQPNKYSVPIPITEDVKATLKQTAGVGRSFDWQLLAL